MNRQKFRFEFLEAAAVFLLYLVLMQPTLSNLGLSVYQSRDFDRGQMVAAGKLIFYGPELSGGGNLPGGLYYAALAVPLGLGLGWWGVGQIMLVFSALGAAILWIFFRRQFGLHHALLAATAFSFNPLLQRALQEFKNSSFVIPFAIGILAGLYALFAGLTERRRSTFIFVAVCLGLGLQFHISLVGFVLSGVVLQILAKPLKLSSLTWQEVWPGFLVLVALLSPYFAFLIFGFGEPALSFTGGVEQSPLYVVGRAATQLTNVSLGELLHLVREVLLAPEPWLILTATVAAAPWIVRSESAQLGKRTKVLFALLLPALIPAITMTASVTRSRYGICFAAALLFVWPLFLDHLLNLFRGNERRGLVAVLAAVTLAAFLFKSSKHSRLSTLDLEAMAKAIHQQTGWSYDEARDRVFILNLPDSFSIRHVYNGAKQTPPPGAPDGFFAGVVLPRELRGILADKSKWVQKLAEQSLSDGVQNGGIQLGDALFPTFKILLIPYFIKDREQFPNHMGNVGGEYYSDILANVDRILKRATIEPKKSRVAEFYACESKQDHCRFVFSARSNDFTNPNEGVEVELHGMPIGMSSRWIAPETSKILIRPYIKFECENEPRPREIELTGQIGSDFNKLNGGRTTLIAPISRVVKSGCRGKVKSFRLGFKDSVMAKSFRKEQTGPEFRDFSFNETDRKQP